MLTRLFFIIGLLGIPLGILFVIAATVPEFGALLARPFCNGEFQIQSLICLNPDNTTTRYEDILGGIGVASFIAASVLIPLGFVTSLIATSVKLDRILEIGEPAEGTILEMITTGTQVNDQPVLKFRLEVKPAYGHSYEAETRRIIPHGLLGSLALGMTIPVKYDPDNPQDVALDLDAFQSLAVEKVKRGDDDDSLSDKLQELEEAYQAHLITQSEYEKARQRILDEF